MNYYYVTSIALLNYIFEGNISNLLIITKSTQPSGDFNVLMGVVIN